MPWLIINQFVIIKFAYGLFAPENISLLHLLSKTSICRQSPSIHVVLLNGNSYTMSYISINFTYLNI